MNLRAGFVLTGGASRRMGRDKALLGWRGATLVEHVAAQVRAAAGSVTLVGSPERYHSLGLRAIPDRYPGAGPLGGIATALAGTTAEWNLVAACDMPEIDAVLLGALLARAEAAAADCVVPLGPGGRFEPLCAAYRRNCLEPFVELIGRGVRRMTDALAAVRTEPYPVDADERFANLNTPEDHARHLSSLHRVPPRL